MSKRIQLRRGTTAQTVDFTGALGEVTVDTTKKTVVVHDGVTAGGTALAKVSEVPSLVPQATEAVAGKAKIATTAIAQAGTDDKDIITAKKLRNALNATGTAPVFPLRAWVCFRATSSGVTIMMSGNILSVIRESVGLYTITFSTNMPSADYGVLATGATTAIGSSVAKVVSNAVNGTPTLKTISQVQVGYGNSQVVEAGEYYVGIVA